MSESRKLVESKQKKIESRIEMKSIEFAKGLRERASYAESLKGFTSSTKFIFSTTPRGKDMFDGSAEISPMLNPTPYVSPVPHPASTLIPEDPARTLPSSSPIPTVTPVPQPRFQYMMEDLTETGSPVFLRPSS